MATENIPEDQLPRFITAFHPDTTLQCRLDVLLGKELTDGKIKQIVTLNWQDGPSFGFHIEDGVIVIDQCEGISVEDGLSLFPAWIFEEALKDSK